MTDETKAAKKTAAPEPDSAKCVEVKLRRSSHNKVAGQVIKVTEERASELVAQGIAARV